MVAPARTPGFRISLSLLLPRDRWSVPLARHLVAAAMREVGVVREDEADVELALCEACTNVIRHAGPSQAFRVTVDIDPTTCRLAVVDTGPGSPCCEPRAMPPLVDDRGRGLALMRRIMDVVELTSIPDAGTAVHLLKVLAFDETAPGRRLVLESVAAERSERVHASSQSVGGQSDRSGAGQPPHG